MKVEFDLNGTPAVAGRQLFLRSNRNLCCIQSMRTASAGKTKQTKNIMKTKIIILALALGTSTCLLTAQDGNQGTDGQRPPGPGGMGGQRPINPILGALDLNKDGIIDADEIAKASESLQKLDKNGDGKLTSDEYRPQRPGGPGGPGGPGARGEAGTQGGPGGRAERGGPGGPDGQGGFHILPPRAQSQLNLSADQQKQLADLETETKAKLETIVTPEQMQQLKQLRPPQPQGGRRGGGPGGPGGPGAEGRPQAPDSEQ